MRTEYAWLQKRIKDYYARDRVLTASQAKSFFEAMVDGQLTRVGEDNPDMTIELVDIPDSLLALPTTLPELSDPEMPCTSDEMRLISEQRRSISAACTWL